MEEQNDKTTDKIQSIREMIYNTEKSLQAAKAMLLQLEGKKKVGRRKKMSSEEPEEGKIIEGTFDGQIMLGTDGKQYPVPANYASKSKLVEGDMLKLTITHDGSFIYKQIGPVERTRVIGLVSVDTDGNYFVVADGKAYKVLLASVTYFKVEPGDEVTLVAPRDIDSDWGSIENVIQKSTEKKTAAPKSMRDIDEILKDESFGKPKEQKNIVQEEPKKTEPEEKKSSSASIIDEWTPDLEELKKELNQNHEE